VADSSGQCTCHVVVSWPARKGFFGSPSPIAVPETDEGSLALIKKFASTWAEPFRSLVLGIPPGTETKRLNLFDWPPPRGLRTSGSVALVGDAMHPMAMCEFFSPSLTYTLHQEKRIANTPWDDTDRGEGANHAVVDVVDFVELVLPHLAAGNGDGEVLRSALDRYEDKVVERTRPAVLASRQACLDAHDWSRINAQSPLLSRRLMNVPFDEETMSLVG